MRLQRILIASSLLLLQAACSSDKLNVKPASLVSFTPAASIEVVWDHDVGEAGMSVLVPAVTREAVYAANGAGKLYRYDRFSGKKVWRIDTGLTISGGVGAGSGLVLVASNKGDVFAYDEEDGQVRWRAQVSSEVLSAPEVDNGIVVVRAGNGQITGLDAQSGKRLWLYERSTPTLVVRNHAGVVVRNGLVYAGFAAGKLVAVDIRNGMLVWENSVSQPRGNTELERISDITSLPAVDDAQVCAVAFQGRVSCFDAIRGGALWTRELASDKGLALFGDKLYLTDTDSAVVALDKRTGASLWKNDQLAKRQATAVYPVGDYLLLGDLEGYLHVLKREDGSVVARRKSDGSAIKTPPVMLGEGAVVQTSDGGIYAINVK